MKRFVNQLLSRFISGAHPVKASSKDDSEPASCCHAEVSCEKTESSTKFFEDCDAVLIDDDHLERWSWTYAAARANKKIRTFWSVEEFKQNHGGFARTVPIYIDSQLGS